MYITSESPKEEKPSLKSVQLKYYTREYYRGNQLSPSAPAPSDYERREEPSYKCEAIECEAEEQLKMHKRFQPKDK